MILPRHLLCATLAGLTLAASAAPDFEREIRPLLQRYCYDCHDEATQESGLDLERFDTLRVALADRDTWAGVLEKIESHQMPPPKEENPPSAAERQTLADWIVHLAALPDPVLGAPDPGKPLLRRLTRLEYNNSVRDLLGLATDVFMFPERLPLQDKAYFQPATGQLGDRVEVRLREYGAKHPVLLPASGLPGDNRAAHGYRNRGDANNLSPLMLENYVGLAAEIVTHPELPQRSSVFASFLGVTPPPLAIPARAARAATPKADPIAISTEFAPHHVTIPPAAGNAGTLIQFRETLRSAVQQGRGGVFDVPAAMANQTIAGKGGLLKAPFGQRVLTINPDADLWLVGFSTAQPTSGIHLMTHKNKGAKTFELTFAIASDDPDEGIESLAINVLGRRNQSGEVTLRALYSDGTNTRLTARIHEGPPGTTVYIFTAPSGETIKRLHVDGSQFSGDYVLLDDLGFITTGRPQPRPIIASRVPVPKTPVATTDVSEDFPVPAARAPIAASVPRPFAPAPERISTMVERAFRRPPSPSEVQRYVQLWEESRAAGQSDENALRLTAQAILSSPGFLFISETSDPAGPPVRTLNDFELATRLSYFLWASMPDAELLLAAREGKLRDPESLAVQTRRMLRDPKARELSEGFAVQWLRLDQLYTAKPDNRLYKAFYSGPQGKDTLHGAMLMEALLLFETVMIENRSILDFVSADYTWLNPRLAKTYALGLPSDQPAPVITATPASNREIQTAARTANNVWVRTALTDGTRGGFVTMAGPLTVTSLPFRTSPVKRGAWLLETIFNRPPQEPKVAFAIENDTPEEAAAQSTRQKFEAHRNQAACYSCHVRLDPPGFALERFDPIGRWRDSNGGQPVDATGAWNGQPFDGPAGYKAAVLQDPSEFTRGFIEHILSYALGRKLELSDLPAVREIQNRAAADNHRFTSVVTALVQSYPFRHTRNLPSDGSAK